MGVTIDIIDEVEFLTEEDRLWLTQLLQLACNKEEVKDQSELSLTLTDDPTIRSINKEYRGIDRATDVISFALNDGEDENEQENVPDLLGDIIISLAQAQKQASSYGHSLKRELGFLAVHGLLHLLGYDHDTEENEREMFSLQESILLDYGLTR